MTQINNETQIPFKNEDEVFRELYSYIDRFDKRWRETIRPASKQLIESLKSVSEIQKWCEDFPPLYRMFLETMGEKDGGLLSRTLIGTANITEIIDLYEEFHKFYPNVFHKPYFTFFQNEMGAELSFDLSNLESGNILETDCGEVVSIKSENFAKLLFQSAFNRFERFDTYVEVSCSSNCLKKVSDNSKRKEIFDIVDEIVVQCGLKKVWFSDKNHYIATGADISLSIEQTIGILGFVTGNSAKFVMELVGELEKNIGVRIYCPHSRLR